MESPLDPNYQFSNIPQGYNPNILYEIINDEIRKLADDVYQDSLDNSYWKDIHFKFPKYNNPDENDHKKAVDYIVNQMKNKYPDENWQDIENSVRNKISDGIT